MFAIQGYDEFDLIEPITIEVEQINKEETYWVDPRTGRRQPVNNVVREKTNLKCQLVLGNTEQDIHGSQLGSDEEAKGYCIFLKEDIESMNKQLNRGDRITAIINYDGTRQELPQKWYFLHSVGDLFGHFTRTGLGYTRILFSDRDPVG
jgi:hypothetical protein